MHPVDRLAFDRAMVAEPVWNRIETARDAIGLEENVLLHAGPPFKHNDEVSRPILNSACVAAVYEGLASNFDQADAMINDGEIVLAPAQCHDVVVPLAAVVSASMPMHAVYDAHRGRANVYTPFNGGNAPALRLGLRSEAVLEHVRWLNGPFADILDKGIAEGIALIPIAADGLRGGDECHGRTAHATQALVSELEERTRGGIIDERSVEFMKRSPSLFLNLWMAATKCAMKVAEGVHGSCLVTAAGGNGETAGIQVSAMPRRWFTVQAAPPCGRIEVNVPAHRSLGAIGDSAIIDAFGLGAMALHMSPQQEMALEGALPEDASERPNLLMMAEHLGFRGLNLKFGLSARNVAKSEKRPLISLGILDVKGEAGRLGLGIYEMPTAPFANAVEALKEC